MAGQTRYGKFTADDLRALLGHLDQLEQEETEAYELAATKHEIIFPVGGTSTDELKDLGGWKTRSMVDRFAKFATENLAFAASRIERGREDGNVIELSRFCHGQKNKRVIA